MRMSSAPKSPAGGGVQLAYDGVNNVHWDMKYSFKAGSGAGITLNGSAVDLSSASLKFPGSVFLDLKAVPTVGDVLVIGGTFYNENMAVEYVIEESKFEWDGEGWVKYIDPADFTIVELGKVGLSESSIASPATNRLYLKPTSCIELEAEGKIT